ncbi:MAG: AbrB/MazE/SpoVT family DNA-binding domain-containing protein, partial [Candidatus Binatia bacterium]
DDLGIRSAETEVEFEQDRSGRWYLKKVRAHNPGVSRFRTAHVAGKLRMSTEEILTLTRGE